MKIITMYELLGIDKDENKPKKIKYLDAEWVYDNIRKDYLMISMSGTLTTDRLLECISFKNLRDTVEILEGQKKIAEKIDNSYYHLEQDAQNQLFKNKINDIIDYLDYLKSKGE